MLSNSEPCLYVAAQGNVNKQNVNLLVRFQQSLRALHPCCRQYCVARVLQYRLGENPNLFVILDNKNQSHWTDLSRMIDARETVAVRRPYKKKTSEISN